MLLIVSFLRVFFLYFYFKLALLFSYTSLFLYAYIVHYVLCLCEALWWKILYKGNNVELETLGAGLENDISSYVKNQININFRSP